jgi:thioesterase domain-containing protein
LFEAPTIAELASVLQDDTWEAEKSSIVAITGPKNTVEMAQRPFYCIIPPGDELLVFNDIAQEIGEERPFLGLQYGVHGETPFTTIEEMAAYFVEQITNEDNPEPYLLGGYCHGGLIAYEMAQQLSAQGRQVDLVVLIDTNVPGSVWLLKNTFGKVLVDRLKAIVQNGIKQELTYIFERVIDTWKLKIWQPVWRKLYKHYVKTGREWPELMRNFDLINHNAQGKYRVKPYNGSVILLQAEERLDFYEYLPHLGWEGFVKEDRFTDHFVPGNHEQLLRNPNAKVLAQEIKTVLTAVTTREKAF